MRRQLGYIPALDGIRGVAILGVIVSHALGIAGGALGVDLFFVLSGFLITTLLLDEWDRAGHISLQNFYVRRALRLLPALGAYITVVMALVAFATASGQLDLRHLRIAVQGVAVAVFYVANLAKTTGVSLGPFTHLWSLAEEEQFYLVWPIVLVTCLRRSVGARSIIRGLLVVIGVLALYRLAAALNHGSEEWLSFSPDMRVDPILVGCVTALARSRSRLPVLGRIAGVLIPAGAVVTALAVVVWMSLSPYLGHAAGLTVFEFASAIVIVSSVGKDRAGVMQASTLLAKSLAIRPLVATGAISYSLYIWQGLFLADRGRSVPVTIAAVSASFAAAVISRRVIELPFLRRRRSYVSAPQTRAQPALAPLA